jgi:hypothetical protein
MNLFLKTVRVSLRSRSSLAYRYAAASAWQGGGSGRQTDLNLNRLIKHDKRNIRGKSGNP